MLEIRQSGPSSSNVYFTYFTSGNHRQNVRTPNHTPDNQTYENIPQKKEKSKPSPLERYRNSPFGKWLNSKVIEKSKPSQNGKAYIKPPQIYFPDLEHAEALKKEQFTPLKKIVEIAEKSPNKVLFIKGDRQYTASEFLKNVKKVAQGLKERGYGYGDSISIISFPSEIEFFESFFGIQMIGAVPILPNYLSPETVPLKLEECGSDTLIAGRNSQLRGGVNNLSFVGSLKRAITIGKTSYDTRKDPLKEVINTLKKLFDINSYSPRTLTRKILGSGAYNPFLDKTDKYEILKQSSEYQDDHFISRPPEEAPNVVLFSSNTSGTSPKRITYKNRMINESTKRVESCIRFKENDKCLFCVPPNHLAALIIFLGALNYECTLVLSDIPRRSDPESIDKALESLIKNEITVLPAVPQIIISILQRAKEKYNETGNYRYLLPKLNLIISGGSETTKEEIELIRWLNTEREKVNKDLPIEFIDFYAATEIGPTFYTKYTITEKETTAIMKAFPGIEVKLSDDKQDEILIRGPELPVSEIPPGRITKDGYYKTHDKGKIDENGDIKVAGRLDDVIIRGSENILPSEIQSPIKEISGVERCYVYGIHREDKGDYLVCATVVQKKHGFFGKLFTQGGLTEESIKKSLENKGVSGLLIPHKIFVVDELPEHIEYALEKGGGKIPSHVFRKYWGPIALEEMESKKSEEQPISTEASGSIALPPTAPSIPPPPDSILEAAKIKKPSVVVDVSVGK